MVAYITEITIVPPKIIRPKKPKIDKPRLIIVAKSGATPSPELAPSVITLEKKFVNKNVPISTKGLVKKNRLLKRGLAVILINSKVASSF
jgi:hypothetical protein